MELRATTRSDTLTTAPGTVSDSPDGATAVRRGAPLEESVPVADLNVGAAPGSARPTSLRACIEVDFCARPAGGGGQPAIRAKNLLPSVVTFFDRRMG
jgi:hypothetical protein